MKNRIYWDEMAKSSSVNWHIAHTSLDDKKLYKSSIDNINSLFIDHEFFENFCPSRNVLEESVVSHI